MKASQLLHKNLSAAYPEIHKVRLNSLIAAINSTISGQQLTVTGLGRQLKKFSVTDTKHDIKRMDRLIGNQYLHAERSSLYEYCAQHLIGQNARPILIADWSPIPGNHLFQLHRISIPMGGRTLTIYEECFEEEQLNSTQVHNDFLDKLESLLPPGCQPIILSDAIYKTPWFKAIEAKGWYWVGRVRGNVQLSLDGVNFKGCNEIMSQATNKATLLKDVRYSKKTQFPCQGVLFHGEEKGKHKKKKRGGISKDSKSLYYAKKAKQPWLLVFHLPENFRSAKTVVKLYQRRMQIEEGFRDTKNQQFGIGLGQARSRSTQRYNNLLLIAALTLFLLWCIGQAAIEKKHHYKLQANTERVQKVLSNIYLAMQVVDDPRYEIDDDDLKYILNNINKFTQKIEGITL